MIGTIQNDFAPAAEAIGQIFNRGVQTFVTARIQDAIHCKIVINLANSITTLLGYGFAKISSTRVFQKLLTGQIYEGVEIIKAAGYKESKLGGMPSWALLRAGARLPPYITGPVFRQNVKKMVVSSMAQDVMHRGEGDPGNTELDSINGYIVELADKHGVEAPMNRAIYRICKREFARPTFSPLDPEEVLAEVTKIR